MADCGDEPALPSTPAGSPGRPLETARTICATRRYGNGLIGARVEGNELKLKDWYIPSNWAWLFKKDLDMQVTPAIFNYKGRELMVTGEQGVPPLSARSEVCRRRGSSDASLPHAFDLQ